MKIFVFDIQRYSSHDGPGIRTTVFLKGCNMRCVWCENPESISTSPQISFAKERCIGCKSCERVCTLKTISINSGYPINKDLCNACGACASVCPTNALNTVGTWRDVDELVSELLLDLDYWSFSNGGVTISGGEATMQVDALCELLVALQHQGVHTVLQTNGNLPWEKLERIARNVSLFHFDLKGINDAKHSENTGVMNESILKNAKRLTEDGYPTIFRVPLVPGYNDSSEDLLQLRNFLDDIDARFVDVLPYHNLGERKLDLTGMENSRLSLESMNLDDAVEKAQFLNSDDRMVTVSGECIPYAR